MEPDAEGRDQNRQAEIRNIGIHRKTGRDLSESCGMSEVKAAPDRERYRVVSLDIDHCTHDSAVERVVSLARSGRGSYVCFGTVHMIMESHDSPDFGDRVNAADMIVPDGMPTVWMQRMQNAHETERVRAND